MITTGRLIVALFLLFLAAAIMLLSQSRSDRHKMSGTNEVENELVKAVQDAGVSTSGNHEMAATDPRAQKALEMLIKQEELKETRLGSSKSPVRIGELSVCIAPKVGTWADTQTESAIWLDITLNGADLDVIESLRKKSEGSFQLLEGLVDTYSDFVVESHMVSQFKEEIERLSRSAGVLENIRLEKLLNIATIADSKHFGIYLASD